MEKVTILINLEDIVDSKIEEMHSMDQLLEPDETKLEPNWTEDQRQKWLENMKFLLWDAIHEEIDYCLEEWETYA
jgi:hypothetical protein